MLLLLQSAARAPRSRPTFSRRSVVTAGALLLGTSTALTVCASAARAEGEAGEVVTENGFISGSMSIDFGTRKNPDTTGKLADGSPAEGSQDVYTMALNVAKTTEYAGKISRKPRLVSRILGREIQPAELIFDVGLAVRNPKNLEQKKSVGKWVGTIGIDDKGVYNFGSSVAGASQLRMAIDAVGKATAFTGVFSGSIIGKTPGKKGALSDKFSEYSRLIKGKKTVVRVKNVDPLQFNNLTLGEGPAQIYPKTTVVGNLDYDYETGNWYTNGIHFTYTANGVQKEDVVTGSIKWVEDPSRKTNGKGQYEFNLRFNEQANSPASDEAAAFAGDSQQAEDAFFEVDNSVPSMTGTIAFEDSFGPADEEGEPSVVSSKVTYNLNANKLTKIQAVNLFKLWMVIVGPTNDE